MLLSSGDWLQLRTCESGGGYVTNTDNSYYGAYQFDLGTWAGVGDSGLPGNAGPVTQHALGRHGVNTVCVYAMSTAGIAKRLVSCRVVAP